MTTYLNFLTLKQTHPKNKRNRKSKLKNLENNKSMSSAQIQKA